MHRHLTSALIAATLAGVALSAQAALKPGDTAPLFTTDAAVGGKQMPLVLADALKKGPVVLYFFPAAHTAGCNIEAHLFSQAIDQFKAEHATVIGVTAGNTDQLADFSKETEHCSGKFAVAADAGAKVAAQYDAILAQKPEWSSRTSYVIAPDGNIVHVYSNLDPKQHVAETLAALKAIKAH